MKPRRLLSNVSHDMRTPLNGVVHFTNFAIQAKTEEERMEYLKKTRQAASILTSLINDTLEVSRIDSGKLQLNRDMGQMSGSVWGIVLVVENLADEKNITLMQ